ncbi:glutathione peroxidase [Cupriavidus sp. UGS-1]|uniref:glutathione peroxidase n=1 Tax=Cupriavidus sp. UGS-1 TaxID=2899826 RepID=UPI001E2BE061|nr:glutathione peroxidase [Cupriavidus sp. UGS-1]MCD9123236.1 glutathione peroxidase [Cupriavidus sp. UGS-1]
MTRFPSPSSQPPRRRRAALPLAVALALCAPAVHAAGEQGANRPAGAAATISQASSAARPAAANCPATLNFRFPRLQDEAEQNLCQYAGKVVLVVNTASYCGFTPQYEGLEALYTKYRERGLVVLGFPSNDFSQEPGSEKEIADFCFNTYGVKFPMLAKTHVRGDQANPMYARLARESGTAPKWNFHKYLIDRDGRVVASYQSSVKPSDRQLVSRIEQLLAAPPQAKPAAAN